MTDDYGPVKAYSPYEEATPPEVCDECGTELPPAGDCPRCAIDGDGMLADPDNEEEPMSATTRVLPSTSLIRLLAELRTLPGWPNVELNAALLVAEALRALGWPDPMIAATVGVDLATYENATAEVLAG